jgi:SAM-dependent methyltransferase
MRFPDATFDRTLCLLAMNFIPDLYAALGEMIRVTRPGGAVAAAVWDYGEAMEMLRVFWDEACALDAAAESKDERHMPLCRAGELAAMWRRHGLDEVCERPLVVALEFGSFEDFWRPFLAGQGPAGAYAAALPDAQRLRLEQNLRQRLLSAKSDGSITMSARAWAVRGIVPPE